MTIQYRKTFYTLKEIAEHFNYSIKNIIEFSCSGKLRLVAYFDMENRTLHPYPDDGCSLYSHNSGLYYLDDKHVHKLSLTNRVDSIQIDYITPGQYSHFSKNATYSKKTLNGRLNDLDACALEVEDIEGNFDSFCFDSEYPDLPLERFDFESPYVVTLDDIGVLDEDLVSFIEIELSQFESFELFKNSPAPNNTNKLSGHPSAPSNENRKTINSLLKMIIAMAYEQYAYDPKAKKSEVPKRIAEDAAQLGLTIDTDTIRKWLQEGAELIDQDKQ